MITLVFTAEQFQDIKNRLLEIKDKVGPFKMDKEAFAWSVLESSTCHAEEIIKYFDEGLRYYSKEKEEKILG